MRIGKSLVMQIGLACLFVFIPSSVFAETTNADVSEEASVSDATDIPDAADTDENLNTGNISGKDIRYVKDFIVITLRAGMGDEYKVLKTLKTDTPLEVIEEDVDFLRVKTITGEDGWVRSLYITSAVPKLIVIKGLKKEVKKLKQDIEMLEKNVAEMSGQRNIEIEQSENTTTRLQKQLKDKENKIAVMKKETGRAKSKYSKLLESASNVAELIKELEDLKKNHSILNKEIEELQSTNQHLKSEKVVKVVFIRGRCAVCRFYFRVDI
ncbi:MAG: TIGR04211 family SH3 domain-containing protein [Deltaproteobacteria bacterium]|nr:TIGR04211 family SH3 domain-containing protein [Deltaproteobacteria bacterium]